MLTIDSLTASIDNNKILKNLSLKIGTGEIHAIMGPNGSGKSTLSKIIAGHPDYEVSSGSVTLEVDFKKKDLLEMEPHERAKSGVFLAFQYPIEVPGVRNIEFLRASFNSVCRSQGVDEMDAIDFEKFLKLKMDELDVPSTFLSRQVNVDFSGGEKKRNEILQMAVLSPKVAILDETDSGLDVDSLKIVGQGINKLKNDENSFVLITHYKRLLDYVRPDHIHVLYDGQIIKSGDFSLADYIERNGYDEIISDWRRTV